MPFFGLRMRWEKCCSSITAICVFPHPVSKYTIVFSFFACSKNSSWYLYPPSNLTGHIFTRRGYPLQPDSATQNLQVSTLINCSLAWPATTRTLTSYIIRTFLLCSITSKTNRVITSIVLAFVKLQQWIIYDDYTCYQASQLYIFWHENESKEPLLFSQMHLEHAHSSPELSVTPKAQNPRTLKPLITIPTQQLWSGMPLFCIIHKLPKSTSTRSKSANCAIQFISPMWANRMAPQVPKRNETWD